MATVRNKFCKKIKDKGAAMVMVIVAIAFIGMLVAMVLYMSYANMLMKQNDRIAKDNFYTAESVLDIINVGLQKDISDCMSQAYVKVMQTSSGLTTEDMKTRFRQYFVEYLSGTSYLQGTTGSATKYDLNHLKNMWTNVVDIAATEGAYGAYLGVNGGNGNNVMIVSATNSYILLNNLHVVYTDAKGFVSIINTDIRIETPDLSFAEASSKMNLENYSLIANTSLISDMNNAHSGVAKTEVTGSVFGGYDGILLKDGNSLSFKINPTDAATDTSTGSHHTYNVVAGSVNIDNVLSGSNSFKTDKSIHTYVQDINVHSGRLSLDGETYVSDDLDISGKLSEVTLSGEYYGYGNSDSGSNGSSSILINGADTLLNFSNLDTLMLSGHAYVGAMKYDADKDRQASVLNAVKEDGAANVTGDGIKDTKDNISKVKDYQKNAKKYDEQLAAENAIAEAKGEDTVDSIPQNLSDVMTGESISVKANQLLYLVPSDCIGFVKGTTTQVVTKNPMTYDEYKMLTESMEEELDASDKPITDPITGKTKMVPKYETVRLDQLWNKLGGTTYTEKTKAVFRRINGTVMVYIYLDFANEQMANQFYRAYLEFDPEGISNYVSSYVRSITWSNALKNSDTKLTLAANAFDMNTSTKQITLIKDNNDSDHTDAFLRRINAKEDFDKKYTTLMHTTTDDYTTLSVTQEGNEIFENLVKLSDLRNCVGSYLDEASGAGAEIKYVADDAEPFVYPSGCSAGTDTHFICTNGDVIVNADYEGVILARGTIYIGPSCHNINYNPTMSINAFRAVKNPKVGTEDKYAYEVFGKSGQLTYGILTGGEDKEDENSIKMVDLISYENWKKD